MLPEFAWQGIVVMLIGKIVWDWLASGRTKQGEYLTIETFEKHKAGCCAVNLKREIGVDKLETIKARAECHAWMEDADNRLDAGDRKFERLIQDMETVKRDIALILQSQDQMNKKLDKL